VILSDLYNSSPYFKDFDGWISTGTEESHKRIDNVFNLNFMSNSPNNGGMGGYDFTTHMRNDTTSPDSGFKEIRNKNSISRIKKKN
jgi:hypothetical protein